MDIKESKRLDYLLTSFNKQFKWACDKNIYEKIDSDVGEHYYIDKSFDYFYENILDDNFKCKVQKASCSDYSALIFNFLVECDFTDNKKYLSWIISLYKKDLRDRLNFKLGYIDFLDGQNNFYEDLYSKITRYLPYFDLIKKSKFFLEEDRDINKYISINNFIDKVRPHIVYDETEDVHTLNKRETECIINYEKYGAHDKKISGKGEIVFNNPEWTIISTLDYNSNLEFGRYTNWCTSMNKNTFADYFKHGNLFVLIRKGFGSKKHIEENPYNRLQFHFESSQFMDAMDKAIDLNKFFADNSDIKHFFREYLLNIVNNIKENSNKNTFEKSSWLVNIKYDKDHLVTFLKKYRFLDLLIEFYSKEEVTYLNLVGGDDGDFKGCDFSKLKNLESIRLEKCGFKEVPESISQIKKLKKIELNDVKNLSVVPEWLCELRELDTISITNSEISDISPLTKCTNLNTITLGGNYYLTKIPNQICNLKKLEFLIISFCGMTEICEEILKCQSLVFLDFSYNKIKNLDFSFSELPNLRVINLDENRLTEFDLLRIKKDLAKDVIFVVYDK